MAKPKLTRATRAYFRAIGAKGGSAGAGVSKRRGDSEYYRTLALRRARLRAAK